MKQVRESEMEKTESAFESDSSSLRTPGDVKKSDARENTTPRRTIGGVGVRGPSSSSSKAGTESFSQKAFVRPSFPIVVLPPTRDKIDVELVRELVHSLIRRKIIEREGRRPSSAVVASRKRGCDLESKDMKEREKKVSKRHEKRRRRRRHETAHTKKTSPRTVSLKLATNSSVSALFSSSSSSSTPASIPSSRFFFFFFFFFFSFCCV